MWTFLRLFLFMAVVSGLYVLIQRDFIVRFLESRETYRFMPASNHAIATAFEDWCAQYLQQREHSEWTMVDLREVPDDLTLISAGVRLMSNGQSFAILIGGLHYLEFRTVEIVAGEVLQLPECDMVLKINSFREVKKNWFLVKYDIADWGFE